MNSTGGISFAISPSALDTPTVKRATHRFSVFAGFYSGGELVLFAIRVPFVWRIHLCTKESSFPAISDCWRIPSNPFPAHFSFYSTTLLVQILLPSDFSSCYDQYGFMTTERA